MKKLGLVGVVAVVFLLAGCSAPASDVPDSASKSAPSSTEPASAPSAAPITAEPTAPTGELTRAQERGFKDENDWFLRGMAGGLSFEAPDDDALIGAGLLACHQMRAGTPREEVTVIEGGTAQDNSNIATMAAEAYCPEFF